MQHRQIEAFAAVMTSGSASRAAELLGVTQPAISRCIAELERELGFALFDRIRSRMVPTFEGQMFFREVDSHFLAMAKLEAAATRIREFGAGELKIASLHSLGGKLVPKAVALFQKAFPRINVTLQVQSSSQVRDLVASGQFDLGLCSEEIDLNGVEHQHFADYRMVAVVPRDHPLAERAVIRPGDLHDQPLLRLDFDERLSRDLQAAFAATQVKPRAVVDVEYSATVCALASEGAGIGLVNPAAIPGLDRSGFKVLRFEPTLHFRKHLVFPPGRPRPQLVRDFLGVLAEVRNRFALQVDNS
ncbi:LysR substrate-binding domain-containing protein [Bosea robiniae]|uniref:DNA-binding transcriptional regulator, LysR family n=1 Tax=Bosea robiniae TaxID=1036780 RepID=A0ABY0P0U6_9HYPH|nr:LysR substrate-binding domain-containing protein [Bosea robiniae]SDG60287.1 DNA-binding transcriptional regulator, LysR family [Bosea robiniae]